MFALAIFLPLLFIVQLATLGAAFVAALTPIYLFVRRKGLVRALLPRAFLLIVPAFAMLSVLWSEAPRETFRFAAQLGLTALAGLLLSSAPRQETVIRGMTLAFFTYVAVAVLAGGRVGIGVGTGGEALAGLTESKNLLGDIASTGLLVSMAAVMMAIRSRSWTWVAIGGLAMGLDLYAVVAARSAGALLGLGMGVGAMCALTPLTKVGPLLRGWLTGAVALCLLAGGLGYRTIVAGMINLGADLFDKDPTLTGRTYLWYRAADLIHEKPMLGRGYYAFWRQGNTDAEGLWRYFGIESRGGFTFHNTLVDILVTLGWLGVVVIAVVVLIAMAAILRRFVARPDLSLVFWISILLYQMARTPIETIGIAPFYFSTVLTFGALGAAFGGVRQVTVARRRPVVRRPVLQLRAWEVDRTGHGRAGRDGAAGGSIWRPPQPTP
ncbi:MAG: O-antigen ligase family protein [Phenylobacterium sp.]|nr:O-antigen ligase family protein [Phenylobacterium sp.]